LECCFGIGVAGAFERIGIADTMFVKLFQKLRDLHMMAHENVRERKMFLYYARKLTIMVAVEKFINDPNSEGFEAELDAATIYKIQPLLFCTEEISLFAFSENLDQIVDLHHFTVMEVLLATLEPHFLRSIVGSGDYEVDTDGFFTTTPRYSDIFTPYTEIRKNLSLPSVKVSYENAKTALKALREKDYKGIPVVSYMKEQRCYRINRQYVEDNFDWSQSENRWVSKFDEKDFVVRIFQEAYQHPNIRRRKCLLGTTFDQNIPFLLDTMEMKPGNHGRGGFKLTNVDPPSDLDDIEPNENYFHGDLEEHFFQNHLRDIGWTAEELNPSNPSAVTCKRLLYDFPICDDAIQITLVENYPLNIAENYAMRNGVNSTNKRKADFTKIVEERDKELKRRRLGETP